MKIHYNLLVNFNRIKLRPLCNSGFIIWKESDDIKEVTCEACLKLYKKNKVIY